MSKTNIFETGILNLIFANDDTDACIAAISDGLSASTTAGSLYVSLHTADPGEAGNQTTSEADYTSYARVAVARSAGGWTVAGNNCSNTAAVTFPEATGGTNTITYFGVGTASTGTGYLLASGAITDPGVGLAVAIGITPAFAIGELDINED